MTRGLLPIDELKQIDAKLPNVISLRRKALQMYPDLICMGFNPGSDIPVAAICFQDVTDVLCSARIALSECHAYGIYYRQYKNPPEEGTAILWEQFFLDDLALRLYAVAEHLASAIIFMLELTDKDLEPFKSKLMSKQSIVGHYLTRHRPDLQITSALIKLSLSKDWQLSMDYRGRWVHSQPPTVKRLGIVYRRHSRWTPNGNTGNMVVHVGVGDKPEYSIEQVRGFLEQGFIELISATQTCMDYFEGMLRDVGFKLLDDGRWQMHFGQ